MKFKKLLIPTIFILVLIISLLVYFNNNHNNDLVGDVHEPYSGKIIKEKCLINNMEEDCK